MTRLHYRLLCQDPLIYSIHVRFKNLGDGISNIYLIHDEDEWLMIDAGAPGEQSYGIITRALQEIGVDMSKLKLFLTHQHFDHSGQVNNILLPHTPIYGAAIGFESRRPPLAQNINELFFRRMLAMGSSPQDAQSYEACNRETVFINEARFNPIAVSEGDVITVGKRSLYVYETPGHSPDSLSLFDPDKSILFCGDHVLTITTPAIDAFFTGEDSYTIYLESLQKVKTLSPRFTLPVTAAPSPEDPLIALMRSLPIKLNGVVRFCALLPPIHIVLEKQLPVSAQSALTLSNGINYLQLHATTCS